MTTYRHKCSGCARWTESPNLIETCAHCGQRAADKMEYGTFGRPPFTKVKGGKPVSDSLGKAFAISRQRYQAEYDKDPKGFTDKYEIPRGAPDAPETKRLHY